MKDTIEVATGSHREAVDRFAEEWWDGAPSPAGRPSPIPTLSYARKLVIRAERV